MAVSFLLSLREGLEAALVLGMVLGALVKLQRFELRLPVWLGAGAAAVLSAVIAVGLNALGMEFEGRGRRSSKALPCCWQRGC